MIRWGATLLVIGIGSFIVPFFGQEFPLVNLFGGGPAAGVFLAVVGGILLAIGSAMERRSSAPTGTQPSQTTATAHQAPTPPTAYQSPPPPSSHPPVVSPPATSAHQWCIRCGQALPAGAAFCGSCGHPVAATTPPPAAAAPATRQCSNCGRTLPPDKNFCTGCGTRLS